MSLYSRYIVYFTVSLPILLSCINALHTQLNQNVILHSVLCVKYELHLFVNQKLKNTIKLDQLQRHGHKLSLTFASNSHSFHLAFEIANASNEHKSMYAQRHKGATKLTCSPFYSTQSLYKLYRAKSDGGLLTAVKQTPFKDRDTSDVISHAGSLFWLCFASFCF